MVAWNFSLSFVNIQFQWSEPQANRCFFFFSLFICSTVDWKVSLSFVDIQLQWLENQRELALKEKLLVDRDVLMWVYIA